MALASDEAFLRGLGFFSAAVSGYSPGDWGRPTPCQGWRAVDVLGHVGAAVEFGTGLLAGEDPRWRPVEPPGDVVTGDPAIWWARLVPPAAQAVGEADLSLVIDSPTGRRSIGEGLSFPAVDLFVHGWDLAAAVGRGVVIPGDVVHFFRSFLEGFGQEQLRSPRVFGPEVAAPLDASPSVRLLAWTGRDPFWRPPS